MKLHLATSWNIIYMIIQLHGPIYVHILVGGQFLDKKHPPTVLLQLLSSCLSLHCFLSLQHCFDRHKITRIDACFVRYYLVHIILSLNCLVVLRSS